MDILHPCRCKCSACTTVRTVAASIIIIRIDRAGRLISYQRSMLVAVGYECNSHNTSPPVAMIVKLHKTCFDDKEMETQIAGRLNLTATVLMLPGLQYIQCSIFKQISIHSLPSAS